MTISCHRLPAVSGLLSLAFVIFLSGNLRAQDRLKSMPGYESFQKVGNAIAGSVEAGVVWGTWADGGKAYEFQKAGKTYRFDIESKKMTEVKTDGTKAPGPFFESSRRPKAGRRWRRT